MNHHGQTQVRTQWRLNRMAHNIEMNILESGTRKPGCSRNSGSSLNHKSPPLHLAHATQSSPIRRLPQASSCQPLRHHHLCHKQPCAVCVIHKTLSCITPRAVSGYRAPGTIEAPQWPRQSADSVRRRLESRWGLWRGNV